MTPGFVLLLALVMALATGAAATARDEGAQFMAGFSAVICGLMLLGWVLGSLR